MQFVDFDYSEKFVWLTSDDNNSVVTDAWDANTVVFFEFQSIQYQGTTNLLQQINLRRAQNFTLIGICTASTIEALANSNAVSAVASSLKLLDGIIVQKHHFAEVIKLVTLLPTLVLPTTSVNLRTGISQDRQALNVLPEFIRQIRLAKAVLSVCPAIARELKYMGVDDEDALVDLLSKYLSHMLPQT